MKNRMAVICSKVQILMQMFQEKLEENVPCVIKKETIKGMQQSAAGTWPGPL